MLDYKCLNKDYFLCCNPQHYSSQHNLLTLDCLGNHHKHGGTHKIHKRWNLLKKYYVQLPLEKLVKLVKLIPPCDPAATELEVVTAFNMLVREAI